MMHSTNYFETFIAVSLDTKAVAGQVPPKSESVGGLQHSLLTAEPYHWTSDDLVSEVLARRKQWSLDERFMQLAEYFSKKQPCLRYSPLVKQYGWGLHYDETGKIAVVGLDDPRYSKLAETANLKQLVGMRISRA